MSLAQVKYRTLVYFIYKSPLPNSSQPRTQYLAYCILEGSSTTGSIGRNPSGFILDIIICHRGIYYFHTNDETLSISLILKHKNMTLKAHRDVFKYHSITQFYLSLYSFFLQMVICRMTNFISCPTNTN
jgi:hypothetical protein